MSRFIWCVVILALITPALVMLYGVVFRQLYTTDQGLAAFLLFMMGAVVALIKWEELK